MQVARDLAELERDRPTVLTIGTFDGVHRGHQWLIGHVVERAKFLEAQSLVISFDPRPLVVLRPGNKELTDATGKIRLMERLAPDVFVLMPFTRELSQVSAGDFLGNLLAHVNLTEIWVGRDFAFGHNREGNISYLVDQGAEHGFDLHVVARRALDDEPISSTRVRAMVEAGDVAGAEHLLGHYYGWLGPVVDGFGRGSELGYPTANVQPPEAQLLPATGVYACYLTVDGRRLPAAVNVGFNPVFEGQELTVEAYVLDFEGNLRGRQVQLDFVARLREEERFPDADTLVEAMGRDVSRVRELLTVRA